jgi:hypothetical protein
MAEKKMSGLMPRSRLICLMLFNNSSAIEFPQFAHILTPHYSGFFAGKQIHGPAGPNPSLGSGGS